MRRTRFPPLLLAVLPMLLAACAPLIKSAATNVAATQPLSTTIPSKDPFAPRNTSASGLTRVDNQGAVMVEVTPVDLGKPSEKLSFEVALNTHSVNLSMDIAALTTLSTDNGVTIQAESWDGPRGGHHVSGTLLFPAIKDGKSILEGASTLTLTIVNLDAPARVFEWQLR